MDQTVRSDSSTVSNDDVKDVEQLPFFQMVQYFEKNDQASIGVGQLGPFSKEQVRFRANASLAFPRSDVEELSASKDQSMPDYLMTVNFMGLYGPSSPLPAFYTEELLYYTEEENTGRHFLDVFHHRLISFVYRCWKKYRYEINYQQNATDQFSKRLLSLIGRYSPAEDEEEVLDWERLLSQLNVLMVSSGSKQDILRLIRNYFGDISCDLIENVPVKVKIDSRQHNLLGKSNSRLGESIVLGSSVKDVSSKFCIKVGPVDYDKFVGFLPGKPSAETLNQLLAMQINMPLSYDLKVSIYSNEIPPLGLSKQAGQGLGWSSWLGRPKSRTYTVTHHNQNI